MSKHTPAGPWECKAGVRVYGGDVWLASAWIDTVDGNDAPTLPALANARLIAAAPDLLEALQAAISRQAYRPGEGPDWWEQARAAIAKATGGAA